MTNPPILLRWPRSPCDYARPVIDAFFLPRTGVDTAGHTRWTATAHATGPWDSIHMHAGPPTALLGRCILATPGLPRPGRLGRLAVEILGPVPVGDVDIVTRVVRPGRRIALVEADLRDSNGSVLMAARGWVLRRRYSAPDLPRTPRTPPPPSGSTAPRPPGFGPGYLDAIRWESVEGSFASPGPATVWARPRVDLVAGVPITPLESLLSVADSGNGISAVADPREVLFVNTDLTVHLWRDPVSVRVSMAAVTEIGPTGSGVAHARLGDEEGDVGRSAQMLFIDTR